MKKIAIIGTAGVPARYGGFETLVHQLVPQLNERFKLHVYCSTHYYEKEERQASWKKARLHHIPLNANGAQSILYDILSILHALFYADVLVILGVSGGILIPFVKLITRKKIIVNIDGLEWRREKWSYPIRKFLKFSEYLAVKFSDADITDNLAIQRYTAINYHTLSHLIEYGADHTARVKLEKQDYKAYPFLGKPYAFKVARIEPENKIHVVLQAFAKAKSKTLVVVGNWNKSEYGKQLKEQYANVTNIHLLDPIYDQTALDKLRSNCFTYIHGHSAGGTNPSLVEAMHLELPVLCFDVPYNRATTENQSMYFKDSDALVDLLNDLQFEDYRALAHRMGKIAKRRYQWSVIAQKYANLILTFDYNYQKKSVWSEMSRMSYKKLQKSGLAHQKSPHLFFEED